MVEKKTGSFESFDGTPIYYEVRGQGRPIIMAYGIACVSNHWQHQIRYFSNMYQTVVFDYRGHHHTPVPANREYLTIDAIAQDIHGLTQHLGFETASMWGHSFGAQVLLRTYDMFPQIFENIVFVNGFANNPINKMFGGDLGVMLFQQFKQGYRTLPETIRYLWKVVVTNPIAIQLSALAGGFNLNLTSLKDIEIYAAGLAQMDLEVFIPLFDQMTNYDATSVLDRVQVPTLIVSGMKDTVTPRGYQEQMHRRIKRSQFLSVPYGSHCTQLDLPDFVNLRIEKFLREIGYV
jgi:pimeloyl-ACP methyl ester carboxylesterase